MRRAQEGQRSYCQSIIKPLESGPLKPGKSQRGKESSLSAPKVLPASQKGQQSQARQVVLAAGGPHEELNQIRERLFRTLSKVPIQVESSPKSPSRPEGAPAGPRNQLKQPLVIKYYHERSLADVLELHFACSLVKHNLEQGLTSDAGHLSSDWLRPEQAQGVEARAIFSSPAQDQAGFGPPSDGLGWPPAPAVFAGVGQCWSPSGEQAVVARGTTILSQAVNSRGANSRRAGPKGK